MEAQAKIEQLANDAECAKKSVLDDVEESFKFKELCSKDVEFAHQVLILDG